MKKILFIIAVLISSIAFSQGPQTTYTVTSIANMKTYAGKASRVHVTATNEDYINCPACTPDEVTMYDGAGSRVWKLTPSAFVLSSTYFDGSGTVGDPTVLLVDATPTDASGLPITSNAVFDGLAGKQATLVSGTNIKTVNGTTILGSGDLVVTAESANTLTTPRLINGVSFNGSADIVTDVPLAVYGIIGGAIKAEPVIGRLFNMSTVLGAMVDNVVRFTMVYLPKAATITGVKWYHGTQGAYTADGYNGVGLYTLSAGTLTLVASSTNDGNIWKAASTTVGSKAFSSTYAAAAGVYVVAALYCHSAETTAPEIGVLPNVASATIISTFDFANSVKLFATLLSQTSLPASQASSGINGTTTPYYLSLY